MKEHNTEHKRQEHQSTRLVYLTTETLKHRDNKSHRFRVLRASVVNPAFGGLVHLCSICLVLYFGCQKERPNQTLRTDTLSQQIPTQTVVNFQLTESAKGKMLYTLKAIRAFLFEDLGKISVEKPEVIFYDENQEPFSTLICESGECNSKTRDLIARKQVLVRTKDSTYLYTDSLIWRNKEALVTTDAWVRIESKKGTLEGQGLISDAGLKEVLIKGPIKGKSTYEFEKR